MRLSHLIIKAHSWTGRIWNRATKGQAARNWTAHQTQCLVLQVWSPGASFASRRWESLAQCQRGPRRNPEMSTCQCRFHMPKPGWSLQTAKGARKSGSGSSTFLKGNWDLEREEARQEGNNGAGMSTHLFWPRINVSVAENLADMTGHEIKHSNCVFTTQKSDVNGCSL